MAQVNEPLIFWVINCFDKQRQEPLPVYNRVFLLDWSALSEVERAEVLDILNDRGKESKHSPAGFDSAIVTVSESPTEPDRRMLKFRPYFKLLPDGEFETLCNQRPHDIRQASITGEYFEDETGQAMTSYQIIQHVSGQDKPIIIGDAQSVMALGPVDPTAIAEWSVATANTIAQFIQVVQKIARSAWYRGQKTITYEVTSGSRDALLPEPTDARLVEAIFPNADETTAILGYFRQLHAKDKLFEKAADAYLRHCGDGAKRFWVEHEKQAFIGAIDSPPGILETKRTNRRILQLFMYGAGLLHSTSNDGADAELAEFIGQHSKERAVSIFNSCLMRMYGDVVPAYHVIKQDFDYWVAKCSLAAPDRKAIDDLFESYIAEAKVS